MNRGFKWQKGLKMQMELPPGMREIFGKYKHQLKNIVTNKFVDLLLFGSYARGDYEADSDMDLLFLVREKIDEEEKEKISQITSAISLEYDIVLTCFDYLLDEFKNRNSPFLISVRKEGIKI